MVRLRLPRLGTFARSEKWFSWSGCLVGFALWLWRGGTHCLSPNCTNVQLYFTKKTNNICQWEIGKLVRRSGDKRAILNEHTTSSSQQFSPLRCIETPMQTIFIDDVYSEALSSSPSFYSNDMVMIKLPRDRHRHTLVKRIGEQSFRLTRWRSPYAVELSMQYPNGCISFPSFL
jgi:hypothetical protein